jgi:hypothetical protein
VQQDSPHAFAIPRQLDIDDVAAIAKRTPKAIRQLRARGLGPKFRKVDGRLLTDEVEVARWLSGDEAAS